MNEPAARVPRPLAGRRVVELAQFIAGPTAGQLLADFGAEVIKAESPEGDGARGLPGTAFGSVYARSFNTGKESRVFRLREPEEQTRFHDLLAASDAFLCNLAPATLRRAGLDGPGLRARHPHLVVTLISGYGQQDDRTCMDTIAQCESGFAWLNGDADGTPRVSASWPTDFFTGLYASYATAMALCDTARTDGVLIDVTMMEVAAAMLLGPAALTVSEGGRLAAPAGNRDRASAPSGIYRCRDGHAYIYGGLDGYWATLRAIVGVPDDAAPLAERMARADHYDALVEAWTRARPVAEVLETMAAHAIPAGPVRHPAESIGMISGLRGGALAAALPGGEHLPAFPALFDGTRPRRSPAPALGGPKRTEA